LTRGAKKKKGRYGQTHRSAAPPRKIKKGAGRTAGAMPQKLTFMEIKQLGGPKQGPRNGTIKARNGGAKNSAVPPGNSEGLGAGGNKIQTFAKPPEPPKKTHVHGRTVPKHNHNREMKGRGRRTTSPGHQVRMV